MTEYATGTGGDALIIQASLNGVRGRQENPNIPLSPEGVAAEARRCADAGASIVHIHARHADGRQSYEGEWYAEALAAIRRETDVLINVTTAREPRRPVDDVVRYLNDTSEPADAICLNSGPIAVHRVGANGVRQTVVVPNDFSDMQALLEVCRDRGLVAEPAVLDSGHLSTLVAMIDDGLFGIPDQLLLEFSSGYGDGLQFMPGSDRSYSYARACIADLFPRCRVLAHGVDGTAHRIARRAVADGSHVRIGFEDTVTLEDGSLARSSADLVACVAGIGRAHGRTVASPADVRALLAQPCARDACENTEGRSAPPGLLLAGEVD